MKLFENAEQYIKEQNDTLNEEAYANIISYVLENGISMTSDQILGLRKLCMESDCGCCPSSDNSAIDDKEYNTTANSQDDEIIDASKGDSSQSGSDPCPQHIEDAIEKEEDNDEFVNDYDEDVKKNESAEDMYAAALEMFMRNGVTLDSEQLDALREEFLLEAKDSSRANFVKDIKKYLKTELKKEAGIDVGISDTPSSKNFVKGGDTTFNLKFNQHAAAKAYWLGVQNSSATNGQLAAYIEDSEDDIKDRVKAIGSANGFKAHVVSVTINSIKIKVD
jgi:hypothetical protein